MLYINSNIFYFLCRPYGSCVLGQQTTRVGKDSKMVIVHLDYEFTTVYKPRRTHVIANVLSILPNISKPLGVLD